MTAYIEASQCPLCFGNQSTATNYATPVRYCHLHGMGGTPTCSCTMFLNLQGVCKACLNTNTATIAMMRKIQGAW